MIQKTAEPQARSKGFSLIEVLIGVFLIAVAVLGLVQLYLMGIMNTTRSSEIANAVFLAQQEVDYLRTLTNSELSTFPDVTRGESSDEMIDVNVDGTPDYRRIVILTNLSPTYDLEVLVFPATEAQVPAATLIANPQGNRVRARVDTVISR